MIIIYQAKKIQMPQCLNVLNEINGMNDSLIFTKDNDNIILHINKDPNYKSLKEVEIIKAEYNILYSLQNLEIEEGEVLKEIESNNRYEQFINESEYQSLFEDYINVKKSNINEVCANPLYFIKKIIYFYNKETFLDPYFLYLKSPSNPIKEKKEKYISFEAKNIEDNKEACLRLDLTKNKFDVMIKPDNRTFSIFFNVENNNINIPISNFDKGKNEVSINSSSKKLKLILNKNNSDMNNKGPIKRNNLNSVEQHKNKRENYFNNNSLDDKNIHNENNTNSSQLSNNQSKKGKENSFNNILSEDKNIHNESNTNSSQLSNNSNKKEKQNSFNNNSSLDKNIHNQSNTNSSQLSNNQSKKGDKSSEFTSKENNKTFELMCNISLNRDIKVKTFTHKNPDKINSFFNLDGENQINVFQIDTYIPKIAGKEINKIYARFPNNFLFFEELKINNSSNYEIIGEVSQNIVNNAKQKIAQEFNYIHLINQFNNYAQKDDKKFIALCKYYGLNNIEKIFILFTDGSYILIKYLINLIERKKNDIMDYFQQKKKR